jgi:organic hydroperoxide reductase OsmC/OhrA
MSEYQAQIAWQRQSNEPFLDLRYSRAHSWKFDGGVVVPASSAVHSVPAPYSKPENVDPEEALVAAISSCHLLTFLYVAAKSRFIVDSYEDIAVGTMAADSRGRQAITTVVLAPKVVFSGSREPNEELVKNLHHEAHEQCYIANSVRSEILVSGEWRYRAK